MLPPGGGGAGGDRPPPGRLLLRAVRILLECILVLLVSFTFKIIPLFLYSFDLEWNNIVYVSKMSICKYPSAMRKFASK